MIEKAIIQLLLSSSAFTAIVGTRVRPNILKENKTFPACYVASNQMQKLSCDDDSGVRFGAIEVAVFAKKYEECVAAMKAIREAMDDFNGVVGTVGISILRGEETADGYDEDEGINIKMIEYEAYAQINS